MPIRHHVHLPGTRALSFAARMDLASRPPTPINLSELKAPWTGYFISPLVRWEREREREWERERERERERKRGDCHRRWTFVYLPGRAVIKGAWSSGISVLLAWWTETKRLVIPNLPPPPRTSPPYRSTDDEGKHRSRQNRLAPRSVSQSASYFWQTVC